MMKVYDASSIRNVAIVGHSGSGKTQLVSAMLFDAKMVNRLGMVDEGTTTTDFDDEEIARHRSLSGTSGVQPKCDIRCHTQTNCVTYIVTDIQKPEIGEEI